MGRGRKTSSSKGDFHQWLGTSEAATSVRKILRSLCKCPECREKKPCSDNGDVTVKCGMFDNYNRIGTGSFTTSDHSKMNWNQCLRIHYQCMGHWNLSDNVFLLVPNGMLAVGLEWKEILEEKPDLFYNSTSDSGMSLHPNGNAESWIRERRLRPIYELLDNGNNKKVLSEVDKLLKKSPGFSCAKALKALALIRMNKLEDGRAILQPVVREKPTDDGTIQALTICYRELEEPATICDILEAACSKEQTEELLTHCFMAQVRILDYQKQYKTATMLYKHFKKPTYYGWALGSLYLKHCKQIGAAEDSTLTLNLMERMVEKFVSEQNTQNTRENIDDNIMELYFRAIQFQKNFKKLFESLKKYGYPMPHHGDHFRRLYQTSLKNLNKNDELFDSMKSDYLKSPEDYSLLAEIGKTFDVETVVNPLLLELRESNPNFVVAIVDLHFCSKFDNIENHEQRVAEDIEMAIKFGADKPSFHSEIQKVFSPMLSDDPLLKCFNETLREKNGVLSYDTVDNILRDVNAEMLDKLANAINPASQGRILRANRCFGKYMTCEKVMASLRTDSNLRTKEPDYHDQFIIAAGSTLLNGHMVSKNDTKNFLHELISELKKSNWQENDLPKHVKELYSSIFGDVADSEEELSNDLEKVTVDGIQEKPVLDETMVLIALSILILEYGLQRSPHNYAFRILLSQAYYQVGAFQQGVKLIQGLDLKHVQWDSLGYLVFPQAIYGGLYSEASKMLTAAENMYTGYKRESMEHIITAYKYGSFCKVEEFLTFRRALLTSVQRGQVFCEKRLLEYVCNMLTPADLKRVAESCSRDLASEPELFHTKQAENRDFSVLDCFTHGVDLNSARCVSAELQFHYNIIRANLLKILTLCIMLPSNSLESTPKLLHATNNYRVSHSEVFSKHKDLNEYFKILITFRGVWPLNGVTFFTLGCSDYLQELMRELEYVIIEAEYPTFAKVEKAIRGKSEIMKEALDKVAIRSRSSPFDFNTFFDTLHFVLEAYSFARILIEGIVTIAKSKVENMRPETKKRKDRANSVITFKKSCVRVHKLFLQKVQELNDFVKDAFNPTKENLEVFQDQKLVLEDLLKKTFLKCAYSECYPNMLTNMIDSYTCQMEEMRKISAGLLEYVRNNEF